MSKLSMAHQNRHAAATVGIISNCTCIRTDFLSNHAGQVPPSTVNLTCVLILAKRNLAWTHFDTHAIHRLDEPTSAGSDRSCAPTHFSTNPFGD